MNLVSAAAAVFVAACAGAPGLAPPESPPMPPPIIEPAPADLDAIIHALVATHGEAEAANIRRGVTQVAALWRPEDGDLLAFARAQYIADPEVRQRSFERFEAMFEQIDGHFLELGRDLRRASELELGPTAPIDALAAAWDPSAHVYEDLFENKIAFVALLNFRESTLAEREAEAATFTRQAWAEARLTARFGERVPAAIRQRMTEVGAEADGYIADYNLWMHHVVDRGARRFAAGKKLIAHWNLRDELKARYADGAEGLMAQRTIVKVMERIVTQTIPAAIIGNPTLDWDPFTGAVSAAPADTIEACEATACKRVVHDITAREPDTRYLHLRQQYLARRALDAYTPTTPTAIRRAFEAGRELSEARVTATFESLLDSPLVARVAALITRRLGRALEPQDLWYDGFKARSNIPEAELDRQTKARWPSAAAIEKDLSHILGAIGFAPDKARWLAEHIRVDGARGAGHAFPAARRGDFPRLRTRIGPDGLDYKGFNIAIHELGHNVEQVFSLYGVDHTLLAGVPNTAFTEALAFVFQSRDLAVLGRAAKPDPMADAERVLSDFWTTWELSGVALVDVAVWHWLYAHPDASPTALREAVVAIARDMWMKHYAPVLGGDTPLLGIYSHMIAYPLYLADYPLGQLIAFQIEAQVTRAAAHGTSLAQEIERMATLGKILPDAWMRAATGEPVSAEPLLRAAAHACDLLEGAVR